MSSFLARTPNNNICQCNHAQIIHGLNGKEKCSYLGSGRCYCTSYQSVTLSKVDELIQLTADQLDIPYRVSKADREYCVYYIGQGNGLIELVIMTNLGIQRGQPSNSNPWFVTWTTPTTTHKETLAKFTDILMLCSLLQEGVNAQNVRKAEAHK